MFPLKKIRKKIHWVFKTEIAWTHNQREQCCLEELDCLIQLQRFPNACLDISVMGEEESPLKVASLACFTAAEVSAFKKLQKIPTLGESMFMLFWAPLTFTVGKPTSWGSGIPTSACSCGCNQEFNSIFLSRGGSRTAAWQWLQEAESSGSWSPSLLWGLYCPSP